MDPETDLAALASSPAASAMHRLARVRDTVIPPLAAKFPEARFRLDGSHLVGLGYYSGLCMHFWVRNHEGVVHQLLGDGGMTPWTATLLADDKERFFASGIGIELIGKRFRTGA